MPRTLALSKVTPLLLFLKLVAAVAIAATSCAYSVFAGADWQLKRIVSYDFQQADYNLSCDGVSWNLSDAYRLSPLSLVIRSDADFTFPPDLYAYWSDDGATKLGIPIFCTIGLAPADPDVPCCGNTDIQVQVVTPLRHNSFVTVDGCMNLFPTYLDDVLLHSPSHRYVILEIDPTGDPSPSNNRLSVEVVPPCPPLEFTPFYQGAAVYPPLDLRVPLTFGASGGCTTVKSGCALCATASMLRISMASRSSRRVERVGLFIFIFLFCLSV